MRSLAKLAITLAALWSGLWFAGSYATEEAARRVDGQALSGWRIEVTEASTGGFPLRFQTEISDLHIRHNATGWGLEAAGLQLDQLSFQPQGMQVGFPTEFTVMTPYDLLVVTSSKFQISGVLRPFDNVALNQTTAGFADLMISSHFGWTAGAYDLDLSLSQAEMPNTYQFILDGTGLLPPGSISHAADPEGMLPVRIEQLGTDAFLLFDRPLDREITAGVTPRLTEITVNDTQFTWGDLRFSASGTLTVGTDGVLTGDLDVYAENWREMVDIGVGLGLIPAEMRGTWLTGLTLLSAMSGETNDITSVLSYSGGLAFLGPIPIGPAPRLAPPQRQ